MPADNAATEDLRLRAFDDRFMALSPKIEVGLRAELMPAA